MENKLLYSYAIVKSLYERYGDYIDTFYVFVLKVLPENSSSMDLKFIQDNIQKIYGLSIPIFSLQSIVTRARKSGYVTEKAGLVVLTEKAKKYLGRLEAESETNRRINKLLENIRQYLNDPDLDLDKIYKILLCFINENLEPVIDFFDPDGKYKLVFNKGVRKYEQELIEYFKIINQREPELYRILQDIVYGSVLSLSLVCTNISGVTQKFKDVEVFLDSNVIFSLFDLHYPEFDNPVKELFELLKKNKLKVKVFDFTIQEMVHVLGAFSFEEHMYFSGIKVHSIYSNLKEKGWTILDVREFIQKIEEKIWSLGIEIQNTEVDLSVYSPSKEYIDKLQRYKPLQPYQNERIYCHDLAALEIIKKIRAGVKREIEKCRAIFLTSDLRLSRFDFIELKHKENFTICEIIPDRLFTNILWLKNPSMIKEISLHSIIAIHSRGMFVDQKIWKRFYFNVKKMRDEKHIDDRDIATLFYSGHIEEILRQFDESDIMKITPDFIEEILKEIKENLDNETQRKLELQKVIFTDQITKEIALQKKWEEKINSIKSKIEKDAKDYANVITRREIVIFYILIIVLFFSALYFTPKIVAVVALLCGILGFCGLRFDVWHIKSSSVEKKFNLIYQKKIKDFKLD